MLLEENRKLKALIEEYRRSENESTEKLRGENYVLRREIASLQELLAQLRSKSDRYEKEYSELKIKSRPSSYSQEEIEMVKKNLTQQMY